MGPPHVGSPVLLAGHLTNDNVFYVAAVQRLITPAKATPIGSIPTTGNSRDHNSFDPTRVLKSGATLVRQWRGHTHTVLVREGRVV